MTSKFLKLAVVVLCGVLLVSCGKKAKQTQVKNPANDSVDLTIGLMPVTDCLPFYVAGYTRLFQKNDVRIKVITYNSSLKCGTALSTGKIDGAYLTLPEMLYLNEQGVGLKALMASSGTMTVVTSRTKRIKKLSSMSERTIAVSRNNTSDFLVDEIAAITKIKPFELLRPQINDISVRYKMLLNNQIDAAVLPEPYSEMAIENGNVSVFSTTQAKVKFGSICFRDVAIKKKSPSIKKLFDSYTQASEQINKNRHKADSVLYRIYKMPATYIDSVKIPVFTTPEKVNEKDLKRAAEWGLKRKFLTRQPATDDVLSNKFIGK